MLNMHCVVPSLKPYCLYLTSTFLVRVMVTTKTANQPKPSETTRNQPKPPATSRKPSKTTHKLTKTFQNLPETT